LHDQLIFQSLPTVKICVCLLPSPVKVWVVVHLGVCVGVGAGAWVAARVGAAVGCVELPFCVDDALEDVAADCVPLPVELD